MILHLGKYFFCCINIRWILALCIKTYRSDSKGFLNQECVCFSCSIVGKYNCNNTKIRNVLTTPYLNIKLNYGQSIIGGGG